MNLGNEFKKFAMSEGISSLNLDSFENSMTLRVVIFITYNGSQLAEVREYEE
jgi:hypothetical protein